MFSTSFARDNNIGFSNYFPTMKWYIAADSAKARDADEPNPDPKGISELIVICNPDNLSISTISLSFINIAIKTLFGSSIAINF